VLEALARLDAKPEVDLEPVLAAIAKVDLSVVLERMDVAQATLLKEIEEASVDLRPLTEAVASVDRTTRTGLDVTKRIEAKPPTDLKPVLDALAKLKKTPPKVDFKPLLDAMEAHFSKQAKALATLAEGAGKSHSILWSTPSGVW